MKIALVGNQNSGKTTLFNLLTGSNQKIGNWPGVTIERKEGIIKNTDFTLVDLPGIYSLSPYTADEEVSRKYIMDEKPNLIINIVDATCIERSMYLSTQLLELKCDVIIALNMCDSLLKKGIEIDEVKLSYLLHTSIVKISALKDTGISTLIDLIKSEKYIKNVHQKIYPDDIEKLIDSMIFKDFHKRFVSVKMIEHDPKYDNSLYSDDILLLEKKYGYEADEIIANERYEYITSIKKKCVIEHEKKESITDKLDKVFLHKWLAIPIFVLIMGLVYFLAVGLVGSITVDLVNTGFSNLSSWMSGVLGSSGASAWSISLVCDGIITGVGAVLNFVPQLIILFLCISLLETSGYMSRIAFIFDCLFRKVGLSGKSLIPFIIGSGCSVPSIMSTRTIDDENEKRITIMCAPFIPCSAKLPIIALFTGFFFDKYSGLVTVLLYFMAIVVIMISALIMKKFFFRSNGSSFISELPEYKIPSFKYVFRDVFDNVIAFFKRAGTIILLCSIVIWFMLSFGFDFWNGMVENIDDSILASIGKAFSWIFYPILGESSWAATVSAIQGLVAKEQVVSSMRIISGLSESIDGSLIFSSSVFGFFNPASAFAYCVFCLFSAPCFGAIGAMNRELGSKKRMWQAVIFQTTVAWVLAVLSFGVGSLILIIV